MDKKVRAFQSLWHMIPTTPHPLTPALPWVPSPFSQSRSIPDVGRFGHCPWTVWTSSFSLPALMITPAGLLPIFMPALPLSSHILMEIPPYSYLWQGEDYLKDTVFIILIDHRCTSPSKISSYWCNHFAPRKNIRQKTQRGQSRHWFNKQICKRNHQFQ